MNDQLSILLGYLFTPLAALAFVYYKRRHKRTRLLKVLKVLFSPKIWLHPSSRLDFAYAFINYALTPLFFVYIVVSSPWLGQKTVAFLQHAFGARSAVDHPVIYVVVSALTIYIAYEFAFWLNHYMSHRIRFLWEFHKVHHAAKVMTPITVLRVHIVDTIVYTNMTAGAVAIAQGVVTYMFGQQLCETALALSNGALFIAMSVYGHLQHSHLWMSFQGVWGKLFSSPAHHQIHHSNNPAHFNKNLGGTLSLFDWLFGTLYQPTRVNEKVRLGVDDDRYESNILRSIIAPFIEAIKPLLSERKAPSRTTPSPQA